MGWVGHLRLFALFELYLAVMFLVGLVLRYRQYREVLRLVYALPGRWPRVVKLVRQHVHILCTWGTVLPLALSGLLLVVQLLVRWFLVPGGDYTVGSLADRPVALPVVLAALAAMLAYDVYHAANVGTIDRAALEQQLDQAEYWLKSWAAPVVSVLSLGYVNPRGIVHREVAAALVAASELMNRSLYAVAVQAALRAAFGLALWGAYFLR